MRHHLIIAGTGRSGTTFLVRFFTALGLDTHLSRRGTDARLDEHALAGLEDFPFGPDADDLPYLIKNPMLYEFVDQMIASKTIQIDGVIIPVRNLRDATTSRLALERRAMYEHMPWLASMDEAWQTAGNVPGGLIFSLSALDEARTLSMGLHLLVERLVRANVPMVFLDFPRIITDADYLYEKVKAFLPSGTDEQSVRAVHSELADPEKVRTERETSATVTSEAGDLDAQADRIALRRELVRVRSEVARLQQSNLEFTDAEKLRARTVAENGRLLNELQDRNAAFEELEKRHASLAHAFELATEQLDIVVADHGPWHEPLGPEALSRDRIIAGERTVHELLIEFADDFASVARAPEQLMVVSVLRKRLAAILDQIESTDRELSELSARLARYEDNPVRELVRRITPQALVHRLKAVARRLRAAVRAESSR